MCAFLADFKMVQGRVSTKRSVVVNGRVCLKRGAESNVLELVVIERRRKWKWQVCSAAGEPVMGGWERTRQAARYQAYRALFLLLAASSRQLNDKPSVT
jgi:hypothetical protein